jgi:hypothetical protein
MATATTVAERLPVTRSLQVELVSAFAPVHHRDAAEIGGTDSGSVLYAFDPATRTYWAVASFFPARSDSTTVKNSFQDAGSNGIFSRIVGGTWRFRGDGAPILCTEERIVPKAVLAAWHTPASSRACPP